MNRQQGKNVRKLPLVGWREWLALPALGVHAIKAKVDTGARTSSLHVFDLEEFKRQGEAWLRFNIHPLQRDGQTTVAAEARLVEYRSVKSSSGHLVTRPVILTSAKLWELEWEIELTLACRDEMGFRMLLGREAIRGRFFVDAGRSFYGGQK